MVYKETWTTIKVKGGRSMVPLWVYFVVAGIFISAMMALRTGRKEREEEMQSIEREGEIYMKRVERARDGRSSQ
jgi:malate/lactate dehydrogenase